MIKLTEKVTETIEEATPKVRKVATRKKTTPEIEELLKPNDEDIVEVNQNNLESNNVAVTEDGRTIGIISVDNGGDNTKVFSESMNHPTFFTNQIAKGKEKDLEDTLVPPEFNSHVVKWNDKIYLTNLRTSQSKFSNMTSYKDSKTDDFFIISTLIAVAKYGYDINYLCTCVPFKNFKRSETDAIENLLIGEHTIEIDKVEYNFEIADVLVSIEAQAGHKYLRQFDYYKEKGEVTLLEIGSRTVGFATFDINLDEDGEIDLHSTRFIREKSGTLVRKGIKISNVTKEEYLDYASSVYSDVSDLVDEKSKVVAFGGGVIIDDIKEGLQKEFKNIIFVDEPLYVQVRGMLELALEYFAEEDEE